MNLKFDDKTAEALGWYVYRLVDPRNGETFYVGKGKKNRVFDHVDGSLKNDTDDNLKFQRIKDIHASGLEVVHLIHRHSIETEELAYQIEAAVMDCYPGLLNAVSGHDAGDYGCRNVKQVIDEYTEEEFLALEKLILISVNKSFEDEGRNLYDAVRAAWKIDRIRASGFKLVLAHRRGVVIGAYRPTEWLEATNENFPWIQDEPGRYGFIGIEAEQAVVQYYKGKRIPSQYRRKGASNPIRFVDVNAFQQNP